MTRRAELVVGAVFANAARACPGRRAVVMGDRALTYGELERRANQTARALADRGLTRGDRLVTWCDTCLEVVPVFAGAAKAGVVFAPVNAHLGVDEAVDVMAAARTSLVVVDQPHEAAGGQVGARLGVPVVSFAELEAEAADEADAEPPDPGVTGTDPHVIFFTSGSTGRPKGVILSHQVNLLRTYSGTLPEPRGPLVSPYPLFHMGAWTLALGQWQARGTLVLLASADAGSICAAVTEHRAERINCIPAVWRRVLDHAGSPAGAGTDLSSLRFADTGTSATPPELLSAITAALPGASVRVFYGSTEAGGVACLEHADLLTRPGSCGLPIPFAEVRRDESGELWVRTPLLFDGYFEDPEATATALVDGWYRTGDLAEEDADGYLSIVGRARDVIRTGGETVAPSEVEGVLADHPALADVAVVGVPDPAWGEVVWAAVVVAPGAAAPTVEDLRAHCAGRLAAYKHPRAVAVVEAVPRTPATGQVQRRLLVEQLAVAAAGR
jgi:acyl-CoA synthetase (AMP-forming)/AMP-acid ligase II